MASLLSHHLVPSLPFLMIIITIFTAASSLAQPPTNVCATLDCGNNTTDNGGIITIRYPFWQHQTTSQQQTNDGQHYCGYQSFNVLSCTSNGLLLNLSNHLFHVKTINYSENSLTISYPHHQTTQDQDHCPKLHNLTLPNTLFSSSSLFNLITPHKKTLRFFYNCSLFPPSIPDIACLRSGSKRSYVFIDGKIREFDWNGYCETSSTPLPVNEDTVDFDGEDMVNGLGRFLSGGFKLTWRTPIGACQACEASDGFCGYSNNGTEESFVCFCPDGRLSFHCGGDTGELILGGVVIIAAVFYFVQKKRLTLYKPISRMKMDTQPDSTKQPKLYIQLFR